MTQGPIFIVGCPRSGTTLLSVLLDRHSEISITPETAFYDEIAPKLAAGDPSGFAAILNCWPRLPELGLTACEILQECNPHPTSGQVFGTILKLYAQNRLKPRCGEKTPQHLWHVPAILADFPDASILCLVRDGRDVALSLRAMPWGPASLTECAAMWLSANREIERFSDRFRDQTLMIRYESLVMEPEVLPGIMKFFGLKSQPQQRLPGSSNVVLQRSLQWKGAALEAIDPSYIGRRRNDHHDEISDLEEILGPDLRRLNYMR